LTPQIDIANARLAFPGGLVANLTASRVSAESVRKCRIFAPSLYVSIDMQAQTVRASRLELDGPAARIASSEVEVEKEEPLVRELSDFAESVRGQRPPLVSGENARSALALAQTVREAIAEHRRAVEG
jgi:predicted dehydrogenase